MPYDQEPNPKPEDGLDKENTKDAKGTEKEESFSFLQEKIKPKAISREKIMIQFVKIAVYGLVFGIFACCGFFALKPWAENQFHRDTEKVTIQEDEAQDSQDSGDSADETQEAEAQAVELTLDADSYKEMMRSLYDVAKEADKSVVSVRASEDAEWMNADGRKISVSGLVAADNGRQILILADNSVCGDAAGWIVMFADQSEYPASLVKQDKNTGLAVFGVDRSSISSSTWNSIEIAVLGNSGIVSRGDVVIALGNMFGYDGGLGYGVVSSKEQEAVFSDGWYHVISTDISAASKGTGILLNQKGEVLGLIRGGILNEAENYTANALGISDLKSVMELLLNGESVPYIGIQGIPVTDEISEQQGIPVGLYVTKVAEDSPAMAAGIQNGDVLQEVDGNNVSGTASYEKAVLSCTVGDSIKIKGQRRGAGGYVDVDFTVMVGSRE